MRSNSPCCFLFIFGLMLGSVLAQDQAAEALATQEVLVVKSYSPSLSDAFKISTAPQLPDSLKEQKKRLVYKIKPVAVKSTFEPNKASPLTLKKRTSSTPFNTLFSGGLGAFKQLYLNTSSVVELDRMQSVGLSFYRDGFNGQFENALLDNAQSFSQFGMHHNLRSTSYNVNTQLQFTGQRNNYFGLYERDWDPFLLTALLPEINRNYFKLRTHWDWFDSGLRSLSFQANSTTDNFSTAEQQLAIGSTFFASLGDGKLKGAVDIQGLNTVFDQPFFQGQKQEFTQGLGKASLYWLYNNKEVKLKLGAGIAYLEGDATLNSKLNYYPVIEIFYQKKKSVIAPYLKAQGGVQLTSYSSSSFKNPFLAPITALQPQYNRYNASLGIRSSLSSILNFDLGLLYDQVENFQFFKRLPFQRVADTNAFRLSNAFENAYADLSLYGLRAQLRIDLAKYNFIHFETAYRYFDIGNGQTLLNTPSLQMNWKSQFRYKEFLTVSFNGEVWGDRQALKHIILQDQLNTSSYAEEFKLPLFVRSTASFTVKLNSQFDAFIKARYTTEGIHGQWSFYQEPNLLLLGGITYKFDFQY